MGGPSHPAPISLILKSALMDSRYDMFRLRIDTANTHRLRSIEQIGSYQFKNILTVLSLARSGLYMSGASVCLE